MIGGLVIALLDMSRFRPLRWIGLTIGEIVRNTPILVQLLWVYYVLPIVFGVAHRIADGADHRPVALPGRLHLRGLSLGHPERAGRPSRGPRRCWGLSPLQSFRRIVLPQAIKMTLPPLASNFVQLIKFSSLGAVISVSEITRARHGAVGHQFPAAGDLHLHRPWSIS